MEAGKDVIELYCYQLFQKTQFRSNFYQKQVFVIIFKVKTPKCLFFRGIFLKPVVGYKGDHHIHGHNK